MVEPVLADGSGQSPDHMILTEQLGRCLRPVSAVQGLVLLLYPLVLWPFVLWHAVPLLHSRRR